MEQIIIIPGYCIPYYICCETFNSEPKTQMRIFRFLELTLYNGGFSESFGSM